MTQEPPDTLRAELNPKWMQRYGPFLVAVVALANVLLNLVWVGSTIVGLLWLFVLVANLWDGAHRGWNLELSRDGLEVSRPVGTRQVEWSDVRRIVVHRDSRLWGTRASIRLGLIDRVGLGLIGPDFTRRQWDENLAHVLQWAEAEGVPIDRRSGN